MKVHSLRGYKEVPGDGVTHVTDDDDNVDVPHDLGAALLAQEDAWVKVGASKRPTVKQVLEEVGDDRELAGRALELENASDDPRPTLIEALSAVLVNGGEG